MMSTGAQSTNTNTDIVDPAIAESHEKFLSIHRKTKRIFVSSNKKKTLESHRKETVI